MSIDDDYLIPASRKADAAEALYAATDWVDSLNKNIIERVFPDLRFDDRISLVLSGRQIFDLINARRRAKEGK